MGGAAERKERLPNGLAIDFKVTVMLEPATS
jgi:hypothetical protein